MTDDSTGKSDAQLDITGFLCPMTFVRTRLALDRLDAGQTLAIRLKGQEPRTNVPRSAQDLGHQVLSLADQPDGSTILRIRKAQ